MAGLAIPQFTAIKKPRGGGRRTPALRGRDSLTEGCPQQPRLPRLNQPAQHAALPVARPGGRGADSVVRERRCAGDLPRQCIAQASTRPAKRVGYKLDEAAAQSLISTTGPRLPARPPSQCLTRREVFAGQTPFDRNPSTKLANASWRSPGRAPSSNSRTTLPWRPVLITATCLPATVTAVSPRAG